MAGERNLEKRLTQYCQTHGAWCLKLINAGGVGFPDRTILFPDARILFLELKSPGANLSYAQKHTQRRLRDLGFDAQVAHSWEEAVSHVRVS
jgi:hypothetical protein